MDESQQPGSNGGFAAADLSAGSYPPPQPQPHSTKTNSTASAPVQPKPEPPAAQAPLSTWGHNKRLGPRDVKRFILEGVQKLGDTDGQQVPKDIVRFLDASDVVFLDENNRPVHFVRAVVTWENG